jgi:serine/threonine protein kinase
MLIVRKFDTNLREYLQQSHKKLTWRERIKIASNIVTSLFQIHSENAIHRDLHSRNILCHLTSQLFVISDLGFCGPADKPLNSIYGNLPYIAPEVIAGKGYTFKSDIYSIAMLMWEISSGQPPFSNYDYEYDIELAMIIIDGIRPRIIPGTPLEYEDLMKQCWDADPLKRPNIYFLRNKISELHTLCNQNKFCEPFQPKTSNNLETNYTSSKLFSKLFTSKIHKFENLPEPRNATEGIYILFNVIFIFE